MDVQCNRCKRVMDFKGMFESHNHVRTSKKIMYTCGGCGQHATEVIEKVNDRLIMDDVLYGVTA